MDAHLRNIDDPTLELASNDRHVRRLAEGIEYSVCIAARSLLDTGPDVASSPVFSARGGVPESHCDAGKNYVCTTRTITLEVAVDEITLGVNGGAQTMTGRHEMSIHQRSVVRCVFLAFAFPNAVVAASEFGGGNLLVASQGAGRILEYDQDGGLVRELGAAVEGFVRPSGLAMGPDGHVYVSCQGSGDLFEFSAAGFEEKHSLGDFTDVRSLCFGPGGAVWACDYTSNVVLEIASDFTAVRTIDLPFGMNSPTSVRFDGTGRLWVGVANPTQLVALDPDSGAVIASIALPGTPGDVSFSSAGIGFCSVPSSGQIYLFDPRLPDDEVKPIAEAPGPLGLSLAFDGSWAAGLSETNEIVKFQYGMLGFITFTSPNLIEPASLTFVPWRFKGKFKVRAVVDDPSLENVDKELDGSVDVTASFFAGGPTTYIEMDPASEFAISIGSRYIVAVGGGMAFDSTSNGGLRHGYFMEQAAIGAAHSRCAMNLVLRCDQVPVTNTFASKLRFRALDAQFGRFDAPSKCVGTGWLTLKKALNGGAVGK